MGSNEFIKVRCINNGTLVMDGKPTTDALNYLNIDQIYEVQEHNSKQYRLPNSPYVPYKVRFEVVDETKDVTTSF